MRDPLSPMFDLKGKSILITGASSGIGRATAILCSRLGASVCLVARDEAKLAATRALLAPGRHHVISCDVTNYEVLPEVVTGAVREIGPISGFVHSAGISLRLPLKLTTPEKFERSLAVNVVSCFEICRHLQAKVNLPESGASFVFIASVMGERGQPAKSVYCASKAALVNGARALALELAAKRVRVNCVSPGVVRTEMYETLNEMLTPEAHQRIAEAHPLGLGQADDVANACAFLLSDASRWITGTNLNVDGGYAAQ